jgi:hypothetical protein
MAIRRIKVRRQWHYQARVAYQGARSSRSRLGYACGRLSGRRRWTAAGPSRYDQRVASRRERRRSSQAISPGSVRGHNSRSSISIGRELPLRLLPRPNLGKPRVEAIDGVCHRR